MSIFLHDPDAVLDYAFDWASEGWLADGETISDYTLTASTGLTVDSDTEVNGVVTAWISTNGDTGTRTLACHITTNAGREDERTITLNVVDR